LFVFVGVFVVGFCGGWISVFSDDAQGKVVESFEGGGAVEDASVWLRSYLFFEMFCETVFWDQAVGGDDGFVDVLFGTERKWGRVWDGFDFYVFFAEFDFSAQEFQGSFDSGGETVKLSHDGREEGDWFSEDVYDAEAHGLIEEIFHLEEAKLLMDGLMDEGDCGGGDGAELFEVVGEDG